MQPKGEASDNPSVLSPHGHGKHDPIDAVPCQPTSEPIDLKKLGDALAEARKIISDGSDTVADIRHEYQEIKGMLADINHDIQKMNDTLANIAHQKEPCQQKHQDVAHPPGQQPQEENRPKQDPKGKEKVPVKEKRVRFEDDNPESTSGEAQNLFADFGELLTGLTNDIKEHKVAIRYRLHAVTKASGAPTAVPGATPALPEGVPSYIFDPEVAQKIVDHYERQMHKKIMTLPDALESLWTLVMVNLSQH